MLNQYQGNSSQNSLRSSVNESDTLFRIIDILTVIFILSFLTKNIQMQINGVLVSLLDVISLLLLVSGGLLVFTRPITMDLKSILHLPLFIFVLTTTSAMAGGRSVAFLGTVMKSMIPYYYVVIYLSVRGNRGFYHIAKWILIMTSLASFYAIFQSVLGIELFGLGRPLTGRWILNSQFDLLRSAGPFTGYNSFGIFLLFSLLFSLSDLYEASGKRIWNALQWPLFAILLIAAVLTQSRGILIAILFSLTLWAGLWAYNSNRQIFTASLLLCSPGILCLIFFGAKKTISISPETVYGRLELNLVAFRIFLSNPVIGIGLDQFIIAATEYGLKGSDVHNLLFNILSSAGIFGLLAFIIFYSNSLRSSLNNHLSREGRSFIFFTLIGVTLLFQVSPVLASPEFWIIVGINNGLLAGVR